MQNVNQSAKSPQARGRSSTLDILGGVNGKKTPSKWASHHQRLNDLRERIIEEKKAQSSTAQQEVSNFSEHMADAATESYDRDCALALLSSAQEALYEIDQALNRISNGTYGVCEMTGAPIETERLKAIPWTRFSLQAQKQLETHGLRSRAHLGELGTCGNAADASDSEEEEGEALTAKGERETA